MRTLLTSADLVAPTEADEDEELRLLLVSLTERKVSVDKKKLEFNHGEKEVTLGLSRNASLDQ